LLGVTFISPTVRTLDEKWFSDDFQEDRLEVLDLLRDFTRVRNRSRSSYGRIGPVLPKS